ncbi:hypothetical protein BV20DRAFT_747910 [Pilatotrama ljubarskyi]|nr:hypothetical protein BV20DRAFT_747910 [Pilatotrama ljubarskyi]
MLVVTACAILACRLPRLCRFVLYGRAQFSRHGLAADIGVDFSPHIIQILSRFSALSHLEFSHVMLKPFSHIFGAAQAIPGLCTLIVDNVGMLGMYAEDSAPAYRSDPLVKLKHLT